ncbi:hypothetical protein LJC74_06335 [Eubacteriales bacterium OttesenSCG-928-A19]|nr:hypothetical protein [Eubacteriales bacterium OttesenSCG-928-A19]
MKRLDRLLQRIPGVLSSKPSILIYIFLFFYLVLFALLCAVVPALTPLAPSETMQLIMGNYTNVLSALGASIAAGAGVSAHQSMKALHARHSTLEKLVVELHEKIDRLESGQRGAEDGRTEPSR